MKSDYFMEDGHIQSYEDIVIHIKWLLKEGWNKNKIIDFDDSEIWQKCTSAIFNINNTNEK